MAIQKYFSFLLNPLDSLRTKKVLRVNPTVISRREEPAASKITVFDYDSTHLEVVEIKNLNDCYQYIDTKTISWIDVANNRKPDVESICNHFGIHNLIAEDILSTGQRPKMDEINDLIFCLLNMLYFNEKDDCVESEQISIVLGKNFVISFQDDASRDVFDPLRERLKVSNTKIRQNSADFLFYALIDMIVDESH
jgi:magnesium transporter